MIIEGIIFPNLINLMRLKDEPNDIHQ